jgi:hypothetical protein
MTKRPSTGAHLPQTRLRTSDLVLKSYQHHTQTGVRVHASIRFRVGQPVDPEVICHAAVGLTQMMPRKPTRIEIKLEDKEEVRGPRLRQHPALSHCFPCTGGL